VRKTWG